MIPDWILYGVLPLAAGAAMYYGVLRPSAPIGTRIDPRTLPGAREKHIAEMECELGMCEHFVNGEHPQRVTTSRGEEYWKLRDGRLWKVGTPCPF